MAIRAFFVALASLGLAHSASAQEAVNDTPRVAGAATIARDTLNADLDGNGTLDAFDYARFQGLFAAADPGADFDGSGTLDLFDFLVFHNAFAEGTIVPANAPPDWLSTVPPGEWCATFQRYAAGLDDQGTNLAVVCAAIGPCDVPGDRNAAIPDANTPIKTYRLSIHVFCDDNGSNCAATPADVAWAVATLNANYAPWRIQFVYQSNFINSTKYRTADPGDEWFMKKTFADSPATKLNIYVIENGAMCWGTFPFSQNPDPLGKQGGIVMDDTFFVAATPIPGILTHEVGHCLGLWHTFNGTDEVPVQCGDCYEFAGRSAADGDITGDRCSDTNPTPKNSNHCYDPPGTDPCNGLPWLDTPFHNFMGYSHVCPPYEFTPQQAGRMHCWTADVLRGWLVPPSAPGTPALTKLNDGVVQVAWADNSNNESGFRVQREKKSGQKWVGTLIIADVTPDTASITDSPGAGTFRYRVMAYGDGGDSAWSAWTQITN